MNNKLPKIIKSFKKIIKSEEDMLMQQLPERVAKAMLDNVGVGIAMVNPQMQVVWVNKITRKWFPNIDFRKKPICYRVFYSPAKKKICEYCPGIKTFEDDKIHFSETSSSINDRVFNITAMPVKDEKGKVKYVIEIVRDITQRKQAERRLKESELKYRSLVDNSLEGIGITCGERVIYANKALLEIFGYKTFKEAQKVSILGHLTAESRKLVNRRLKKKPKAKFIPSRCEYKIIRKDGTVRDMEISTSEIVLEGQRYVQSIFRDITETKRTQNSLELTTRYWNDTFNAISDGVWLLDKGGRIIQSNGKYEQWLGLQTKDIIGKRCYTVSHCTFAGNRKCPRKLMSNNCMRASAEFQADKIKKWFSITVDPIYDIDGRLKGAVHIVRDISERKCAEEALRESEEKYRAFFAQAPDSTLLIEAETGALVEFNDKACGNLGYTRKEFQKLKISDFEIIESKQEVVRHIKKIVKEGVDVFETKHRRKDGQIRDILVSARAISVHGRDYIQAIWRDITERKQAEEKIRQQSEFLQKSIESLTHPFYVIDADDYTIKMANHAAHLGKLTPTSTCHSITHKSPKPCTETAGHPCTLKEVKRTKKPFTVEHVHYDKDGNARNVEVHGYPVFDDKGNVVQMIEYCLDITARKRAQKALKESEQKYRKLAENALVGVYKTNINGDILYVNNALARMFEFETPEEMMSQNVLARYKNENDRNNFIKNLNNKGKLENWELEVLTKTGKPKHILISAVLEQDIISGMIMDITQRKQTECALRESQNRYHSLFENSPISLWEEDFSNVKIFMDSLRAKGITDFRKYFENNPLAVVHCATLVRIVDINKATLELYQAKRKDTLKSTLRIIFGKEAYDVFKQELIAMSEGKSEFESEAITRTMKGNKLNIIMRWSVAPGYEQTLSKVFMSVIDVTYRKQAQQLLELLNKELIRSNKRLGKLALRDSHTGVYNYRYLGEAIEREFSRAKRYSQPLSVVMLDIDYFKSINDVYGHQFGDLVLKQFARQLKRIVRIYDVIIRFGGEEFIIISPGIDMSTACILAQRIANAINAYNFGDKDQLVRLKLSAAVASYPENRIAKGMNLIDLADKILNKVKEDGGGRVYSYFDISKEKAEVYEESETDKEVTLLKNKLDKLTKRSNQSLIESVFAFAKTIELKDYYTGKHVENTVAYAAEIAKVLNLTKEEVELVKQAAVLHDLGKIGISEKILLKRSKLTKSELEQIKKHPQIAADIIRPIHFLHGIIPLILHHHERWDGTGYPGGLRGEEIPTGARIICIADTYQALISDRPYRKSYSRTEAIKTIRDGAGTQFDPEIAKTFVDILEQEK